MALATRTPSSGPFAHPVSALRDVAAILGACIRAAGAVERRATPAARDLRILGIAPESFPNR